MRVCTYGGNYYTLRNVQLRCTHLCKKKKKKKSLGFGFLVYNNGKCLHRNVIKKIKIKF